jgi:hypothetical protein
MDNYHLSIEEKLVDKENSYRWLKFGGTEEGTENTVVAAQDQALAKNHFKKKIRKEEIGSKYEETDEHLT